MPIDVQTLIGEVAARNHCRIGAGDPIFAVTTINQLMLEEVVEGLMVRIRVAITEFEASARAVEAHAGKALAGQMRGATGEWKAEIAQDLNRANARCCEMIDRVHRAHSKPAMQRWGALGLVTGLLLIGCGILLGIYVR